jgi:hypothetical protein
MRNLTIALGLLIFGLGGFYGGAKFEATKVPATPTLTNAGANAGLNGAGANGGRGPNAGTSGGAGTTTGSGGGGFVARGTFGQITAINGDTLTLQDAQGNQIKVQLQPNTTLSKSVQGAKSDLTTGITVTVAGQRGSDGTVTANAITIVPAGTGPGGSAAPRG